jgi:hypothetical protein
LEQLHPSDFDFARLLYLQYDNKNLLNRLLNRSEAFIPLGNYTEEFIDQEIKEPENIIAYMAQIINEVNEDIQQKGYREYENRLQELYYNYVLENKNSFLKQWFTFDKDVRNILSAINCHTYDYDIEDHIIATNSEDEVYSILLKGPPKFDTLVDMVPYVDEIFQVTESGMDITDKEKRIDFIKWRFIDEQTVFSYFTIEKILSYIIKLEIVERWLNMNRREGEQLFSRLVNDMAESYTFSEEYSL